MSNWLLSSPPLHFLFVVARRTVLYDFYPNSTSLAKIYEQRKHPLLARQAATMATCPSSNPILCRAVVTKEEKTEAVHDVIASNVFSPQNQSQLVSHDTADRLGHTAERLTHVVF